MQLVVFTIGGKEYALPITDVQEIIRYVEPRPVSSQAGWIRGVISLRGKIVPVCDLAARLGLAEDGAAAPKIVIVEHSAATVGVIVDEVEEVLIVDPGQLDRVPGAGDDLIDTIAKLDDKLVLLLEPARLFDGVELAAA